MQKGWYKIFVIGLMIMIEENHFGWHGPPQSDAEVICDLLVLVACVIAAGHDKAVQP